MNNPVPVKIEMQLETADGKTRTVVILQTPRLQGDVYTISTLQAWEMVDEIAKALKWEFDEQD